MAEHGIPGQVGGGEGGVNPTEIVMEQPKSVTEMTKYSSVGLEELAKTDRVLVQQVGSSLYKIPDIA